MQKYYSEKAGCLLASVTRKKSPNVYKSCLKMISLEKWYILTSLQKLPKNVGYFDRLIVAKGYKKLPKVQKITQSCHTLTNIKQRDDAAVCSTHLIGISNASWGAHSIRDGLNRLKVIKAEASIVLKKTWTMTRYT